MNVKNQTVKIFTPQEPYRFTKRIGSTVFKVNVSFKQGAKETMDEKLMRLMQNEAKLGKVVGL